MFLPVVGPQRHLTNVDHSAHSSFMGEVGGGMSLTANTSLRLSCVGLKLSLTCLCWFEVILSLYCSSLRLF